MFSTLLVANRGEIACRVIRTARRLGIRTVAVHSDADAGAAHVAAADESRRIGPAPAAESYLDVAAIVAAARDAGAQALHPGYGFLSERAELAEACVAAGVVFVGPPPAALRAVGDKRAFRHLMARAGVPVVPGSDPGEEPRAAASRIGVPLIVKAAAGGGGRGMRVVRDPAELDEALAAATREAEAAFGDGSLFVERYLERARHVEVQVVADAHGAVVHLLDRDCSLQRRHQKLVEEAPAPDLEPATRAAMREAAVAAARAVGYRNAGTVEFLLDPSGAFCAIELNARLQVEHAVTEMVTGLDLVEWQLRVAAGEPLPLAQEEIRAHGHAVEARIVAEDPARGLLPSSGRLLRLGLPEGEGIRVDAGVREGDAVGIHYDSLLAKLIVHREDRPAALAGLRRALEDCRILGLATNLGLLADLLAEPALAGGPLDTGFVERERTRLLRGRGPAPDRVLALACLALIAWQGRDAAGAEPFSPWARADGWRLNAPAHRRLELRDAGRLLCVRATARPPEPGVGTVWTLELPAATLIGSARLLRAREKNDDWWADAVRKPSESPPAIGQASIARSACAGAPAFARSSSGDVLLNFQGKFEAGRCPPVLSSRALTGDDVEADLDGVRLRAAVAREGSAIWVALDARAHRLECPEVAAGGGEASVAGSLAAPMPGQVTAVLVVEGQEVASGESLLLMSAMKMEIAVRAPGSGRVAAILHRAGDQVQEGEPLLRLEPVGRGR